MSKGKSGCLQTVFSFRHDIGRTPVTERGARSRARRPGAKAFRQGAEREVKPGDLGRKSSGRARSAKSSPATWGESLRVWHRAKA